MDRKSSTERRSVNDAVEEEVKCGVSLIIFKVLANGRNDRSYFLSNYELHLVGFLKIRFMFPKPTSVNRHSTQE